MDITLIQYKNIYDLIFSLISEYSLQPFYTLNKYKGIVYFYEAIAEVPAIHYTKFDIESGTYIYDIIKNNLIKQENMPKFTEQGQFVIIIKALMKDTLVDSILEQL
jgi:hypothetical protein